MELSEDSEPALHHVLPHEVPPDTKLASATEPAPADGPPVTLLTTLPVDETAPPVTKKANRHQRLKPLDHPRFDDLPVEIHIDSATTPHKKQGPLTSSLPITSSLPLTSSVPLASSSQGSFQELLGRLEKQHESELAQLRAEVEKLKAQLPSVNEHHPSLESDATEHGDVAQPLPPMVGRKASLDWGGTSKEQTFMPPLKRALSVGINLGDSPGRSSVTSRNMVPRHSTNSVAHRVSRRSFGSQSVVASQLVSLELMEVLPVWETKDSQRLKVHQRMSAQSLRMSKVRQFEDERRESIVRDVYNLKLGRILGRLIMHPSSMKRLLWDLSGFFFLSYDIIHIPFASAFDPGETVFTEVMSWLTLAFWSLDMIASMMTGFQRDGQTVMVHKQIVAKYLKTWFLMDAFIVGLDWTMISVYGDNSGAQEAIRQGRSLRLLRYVRTIRLIRLLKLKRMFHEIQDHLNTELLSTVFSICKTVTGLVVANHLIACAWYALGQSGGPDCPSWVRSNELLDRTVAYKYTTSLHWSLTQFTPASMEIRPYNEAERAFSVIVLLLALVSFSSFVSTLTASITRLSAMRSNEHRQFWLLRRYLRDLQISRQLSLRVQRYCEYSWERAHNTVQERDVLLLNHLSEPLREELKAETFAPHLSVHPLMDVMQDCVRRFSAALAAIDIAKSDQVFGYGEEAHCMYFVARGELSYSVGMDDMDAQVAHDRATALAAAVKKDSETKPSKASTRKENSYNSSETSDDGSDDADDVEAVFESDWVSEAALWTVWDHLGYLEAISDCQLVAIDTKTFSEVVCQNAATWTWAQKYARHFVDYLNKVERFKLTDVLERNITYESAKEIGAQIGFASNRSNSTIIRKRERRQGFGAERRLGYRTRRLFFRVSLASQSAWNGLRRLCNR